MMLSRRDLVVLVIAAAALVACAIDGLMRPVDFLRGYLPAFLFWAGVPLGAMAFLLIHQLTGGAWGRAIRQPAMASILTLPVVAVFFVPVILGMDRLYPWAGTAAVRAALDLGPKAAYLNAPFFVGRSFFYFLAWMATGFGLVTLLVRQERAVSGARAGALRAIGAGGLVLYILTATFAAVDWMMSLEPHWYSSIYGIYVIAGQGLTGLAVMVVVVIAREGCETASVSCETASVGLESPVGTEGERLSPAVLHDLSNLLFMSVFFYAYIAFSQYLIIWSGNTAEEVHWYATRGTGAWGCVPGVLAVIHFALPFALLLSRKVKRRARAMRAIALLVLAARVLDTAWMVMPSFPAVTRGTWLAAAASFVGIGGVWWVAFVLLGGMAVAPGISTSTEETEKA